MMNQIILHHHLGLGDHFTCCGLVNTLSKKYDKIYLVCKEKNYETVKCLYSENYKIKFLKILNDEYSEVHFFSNKLNLPVVKVGFIPLDLKNYHMKFYEMVGVDFKERYLNFNLPNDIKGADELYKDVVGDYKEYILVHDSSSEKNEYYMDMFEWRNGKNSHLPIIKITEKNTNNLLEWIKVIKHAKEIHVVPSSVFFLIDSIESELNADLYYHNVRPAGYTFMVNTDFNNHRWNIVEY